MKKRFKGNLVLILLLFGSYYSYCQSKPDSTFLERYLLDFTVPDMPAFEALGTDPSDILRPADIKKFAAMISPFYTGGRGVIAENFAMEVAPWKLASKKWTLDQYISEPRRRFRYNSSFSLGTLKDSSEFSSKVAVGYRVSFLSKRADIYRAAGLRNKVLTNMEEFQNAFVLLTNDWATIVKQKPGGEAAEYYINNKEEFNEYLRDIEDYLKENPNETIQRNYDTFTNVMKKFSDDKLTSEELGNVVETIGENIDTFIEEYKENNWNAARLDIALALAGQSRTDLLSKTQFANFSIWGTGAVPVHKNGQLLLGVKVLLPRSDNSESEPLSFSGSLRYYLGNQNFRGFLESQYSYQRIVKLEDRSLNLDMALLLNLGGEFRIGKDFWVVASAGLDNYFEESDYFNALVSSIDIRYGFNSLR